MQTFETIAAFWTGSLPNGWADDELVMSIVYAIDCERISIGPFERPAKLVWQEQRNPIEAGACAEGAIDQLNYLQAMVVDDEALSAFLRTAVQIPLSAAAIRREIESAPPHNIERWAFGPVDQQSELDVANVTDPFSSTVLPVERLAWVNQLGGISFIEYNMTRDGGLLETSRAKLLAPFHRGTGLEEAVATGGPMWNFELSGSIHHFRDLACLEPV